MNNKYSSKEILCILAIEGLMIIILLATIILLYRPAKSINESYVNVEPIVEAEQIIDNTVYLTEDEKEYLIKTHPQDKDNINNNHLTDKEIEEIEQYRALSDKLTEKYPNTLIEPDSLLTTEGLSVTR